MSLGFQSACGCGPPALVTLTDSHSSTRPRFDLNPAASLSISVCGDSGNGRTIESSGG
jgi:hypothetical protein